MKLIGKGTFTHAFLIDDNTVALHSTDPLKECMAHGWFPDNRLFPIVEQTDHNVYTMKYYPKVRSLKNSLNERDYTLYTILRKLRIVQPANNYMKLDAWRAAFNTIPGEYSTEREALLDALDACCNYGTDINFEISPRNVAVDNGNLVLLDCFFLTSALTKAYAR